MAYSHFGDNFTGQAGDPTNSVTALKDGGYWLANHLQHVRGRQMNHRGTFWFLLAINWTISRDVPTDQQTDGWTETYIVPKKQNPPVGRNCVQAKSLHT